MSQGDDSWRMRSCSKRLRHKCNSHLPIYHETTWACSRRWLLLAPWLPHMGIFDYYSAGFTQTRRSRVRHSVDNNRHNHYLQSSLEPRSSHVLETWKSQGSHSKCETKPHLSDLYVPFSESKSYESSSRIKRTEQNGKVGDQVSHKAC